MNLAVLAVSTLRASIVVSKENLGHHLTCGTEAVYITVYAQRFSPRPVVCGYWWLTVSIFTKYIHGTVVSLDIHGWQSPHSWLTVSTFMIDSLQVHGWQSPHSWLTVSTFMVDSLQIHVWHSPDSWLIVSTFIVDSLHIHSWQSPYSWLTVSTFMVDSLHIHWINSI